jgi:PPOX class probable F420-dependent enzyme
VSLGLPAWAAELLRDSRVARLGTADRAGRPLVVPVCYAFDGRACYSAIDAKPKRVAARDLRRVRNIEANPHVSLVVDRYDENWSRLAWVIVEGRADLVTDGPVRAMAVDLLLDKYAQYRTLGLDQEVATIIRVTPERALAWRYGP